MKIFSFPPIADSKSQILILGTMPGKESLKQNEYYANKRNAFWKIMFDIFDYQPQTSYVGKTKFLLVNRIAIWDVLKACERESSSDNDIIREEANNLESFLESHPLIKHLFFNGQPAFTFYKKYITNVELPTQILPSTSSAHAIPYLIKLERWRIIKSFLSEENENR